MKILFEDLGRNRAKVESTVPDDFSEADIVKQAKPYLMSRDVWATIDDDGEGGSVMAGMHVAGSWSIVKETA